MLICPPRGIVLVALRKESVDRNGSAGTCSPDRNVALRKESVDRNHAAKRKYFIKEMSLSARRAWIEISIYKPTIMHDAVALRKESVDRNNWNSLGIRLLFQSLSARRAWIEIIDDFEQSSTRKSLSARRAWIEIP